ncbi:hypothetical protein [Meiothermus taiwanensis]|jgi:hypothetical protein|uniref:Uncharacterized protein n=2 Tax=Meiothermus taiwanensis TaxID=172827 RepID=A0A399DY92_9DEIN|nr:hypothetical protein [Meiothermus taiwanensis]AWR88059.1 hypothetical protein Mtai_v1c28360 [Meiothermus taiwanensis WR-220]RIH77175.1 hypothetical protein Mcate_01428 [Meiothermus taiwanensis]
MNEMEAIFREEVESFLERFTKNPSSFAVAPVFVNPDPAFAGSELEIPELEIPGIPSSDIPDLFEDRWGYEYDDQYDFGLDFVFDRCEKRVVGVVIHCKLEDCEEPAPGHSDSDRGLIFYPEFFEEWKMQEKLPWSLRPLARLGALDMLDLQVRGHLEWDGELKYEDLENLRELYNDVKWLLEGRVWSFISEHLLDRLHELYEDAE